MRVQISKSQWEEMGRKAAWFSPKKPNPAHEQIRKCLKDISVVSNELFKAQSEMQVQSPEVTQAQKLLTEAQRLLTQANIPQYLEEGK